MTELANSINDWEDESIHSLQKDNGNDKPKAMVTGLTMKGNSPRIVGNSPRKPESTKTSDAIKQKSETNQSNNSGSKEGRQLKWDKKVIDALESQGFKRRDTTHQRLEYDFKKGQEKKTETESKSTPTKTNANSNNASTKFQSPNKTTTTTMTTNSPKSVAVAKGIVSGRMALFENASQKSNEVSVPQKDPTKMSVKERSALFEKNKGLALMPKAALGIAPSVKQIMADQKPSTTARPVITTPQQPIVGSFATANTGSQQPQMSKINNFNKPVKADSIASGSGIRQTVAALLSNPVTISESQIANEVRKAREQEMNLLLNRFNRTDEQSDAKSSLPQPVPPAPPMPANLLTSSMKMTKSNHKRRSGKLIQGGIRWFT